MMELELVSTDDLLDEIATRFDSGVFIARTMRDETRDDVRYDQWGDYTACMGLCQVASVRTYRRWNKSKKGNPET